MTDDALLEKLRDMLDAALTGDVEALEQAEREADGELAALARELKKCAEEIRASRLLHPQRLAALARQYVALYFPGKYSISARVLRDDDEKAKEVALVYEALARRRRREAILTFKLWRRALPRSRRKE